MRASLAVEAALGRGAWMGAVALFIVACGGTSGGRASGSAGGGHPSSPGVSPTDAGPTSRPEDAGPLDAGPQDAGAMDAGSGDAGPSGGTDAGTAGADASVGDAGASDAGQGPDGGSVPDGGVASCEPTPQPPLASCSELMPPQPLPPPVRYLGPTPSSPADPVCLPGAFSGDREGFLGVMRTLALDQNRRVSRLELDLLAPDGGTLRGPAEDTRFTFLTVPLAEGAGVVRFDGDAGGTLVRIDRSGTTSELAVGVARSFASMPGGGNVVAEGGTFYGPDGQLLSSPLRITRRDETDTVLWSTPIPASIAPDPSDAQVYPNGAGHVLAVVSLDAFQVRIVWLDEQGQVVSSGDTQGVFSSRAAAGPSLELPDHSLAFDISPAHSSGGWVVVHDLEATLDSPPCWLEQRKETHVIPIHGGRGYAVFHATTFLGNPTRRGLEIVTSSGESCGWIDATCGDPTPGACELEFASVGLDGTLYLGGISDRAPEQCLVEAWPALFR